MSDPGPKRDDRVLLQHQRASAEAREPEAVRKSTRRQLVALYAELAAHTAPECEGSCERPQTCCAPRYCALAIDFAHKYWHVDLPATWHRTLPLMGTAGCTAAPHLRPICSAHTCEVCQYGRKRGDPAWTARYQQLCSSIADVEVAVFAETFI